MCAPFRLFPLLLDYLCLLPPLLDYYLRILHASFIAGQSTASYTEHISIVRSHPAVSSSLRF